MDHIGWCRDSRLGTLVEQLMTSVQDISRLSSVSHSSLSRTCVHWASVGRQERLFGVVLFIALYFRWVQDRFGLVGI